MLGESRNESRGVKRADENKSDKGIPEYRCRLVAKEINRDMRWDLFAATQPLEANKWCSHFGQAHPG